MTDATPWDDLEADFAWTPEEQADIEQRAEQLRAEQRHEVVDRHTRLKAGHAVGKLLGTPEGHSELDAIDWRDGETIVVLLTTDGPDYVRERLNERPGRMSAAVYDPAVESVTFRTTKQALLDAQLREGIAQAERGETVSLGDFSQYLDGPEA